MVAEWVQALGISDRASGIERARASRERLLAASRHVLGNAEGDFTTAMLVFSGLMARAQGLHEGAVLAIVADNPYAAFPLLRAYSENAAAVLYVKDHPAQLDRFWNDPERRGVKIGTITNYASTRFPTFKEIYAQLSLYAHPAALSVLTSSRIKDDGALTLAWSSGPRFGSEHDAVHACAWVVELAEATSHLLVEFGEAFDIAQLPGSAPLA